MPGYDPPSLVEISKDLRAALKAALPTTQPGLWPNNIAVVIKSLTPAFRSLHQKLRTLSLDRHITTCSTEALDRYGSQWGVTREEATVASGIIEAVTDIGAVIPAGTRLVRSDDVVFVTMTDVTAIDTTTELTVEADEPGKAGNTLDGVTLQLETSIPGVSTLTVNDDGLSGGAEAESDASLRARLLQRLRNPAHGGSPSEYQAWGKQLAGVTRVFVQRATPSPGSVTIPFMMDNTYTDGIPQGNDVSNMQDLLDSVAPSNAQVIAVAPQAKVVNITISSLRPNNNQMKIKIQRELAAQFQRKAEPASAAANFVFRRHWIEEAIGAAVGHVSHSLDAPAANITCVVSSDGQPEIATLGTITWA
jgi:uncharacterized phage protein gp47/JayE